MLEIIMPYRSSSNLVEREIRNCRQYLQRFEGRWFEERNIYRINLALNDFKKNRFNYSPREMLFSVKFDKWRLVGVKDQITKSDSRQPLGHDLNKIYNQLEIQNSKIESKRLAKNKKIQQKFSIGEKVGYRLKGNKSKETSTAIIQKIEGCQIILKNENESIIVRHASEKFNDLRILLTYF